MSSRPTFIFLGDEAFTERELRGAIERPHRRWEPALPKWEIDQAVTRYLALPQTLRGRDTATVDAIARDFGVTRRTLLRYVQRHRNRSLPCPGPCCLTRTPGGRLCHFCRRSEAVAA